MVKPAVDLDIAREGRVEGLSMRDNPIEDRAFKAFGVVGSGTGDTLLKLLQ